MICCKDTSRYGKPLHQQMHINQTTVGHVASSADAPKRADWKNNEGNRSGEVGHSPIATTSQTQPVLTHAEAVWRKIFPKLEVIGETAQMKYTWEYKDFLNYIRATPGRDQWFSSEVKYVQFRGLKPIFDGIWTFILQKSEWDDLEVKAVYSKFGPTLSTIQYLVELRVANGGQEFIMGQRLSGKEIRPVNSIPPRQFPFEDPPQVSGHNNMSWRVDYYDVIKSLAQSGRQKCTDLTFTFYITARSFGAAPSLPQ